jgi:Histidine kinase-like ATPase domain
MASCCTVVIIAGSESPFESPPGSSGGGATGETELPRMPDAGRRARAFIDGRFGGEVAGRVLADARLVTTELVNNAVIHGEGRITLRVQLRDDVLRVEVIDEGTGNAPKIREEADGDRDGGRGLRIVDAVSLRWGTFEGTTHVWADLPLAPGPERRAGARAAPASGA